MEARMGERYLLDNRADEAEGRFAALAALFDPVTRAHAEAVGLGQGWRCWEVGAGGPSVPVWLAERVGGSGHVLATDIDVAWMNEAAGSGVEIARHDVAVDEAPASAFDLVHARLVLSHLPAREQALERMVAVLRPGGWLLVEDFDIALQPLACPAAQTEADALANRIRAAFLELLAARGVDPQLGRTLPARLRALGLEEIGADAYFPVALGAGRALELANVQQVRDLMVANGLASEYELDEHLANVRAGSVDIATPPLVSARGRRTRRSEL
jgi:SAM-dependent methyltransferase